MYYGSVDYLVGSWYRNNSAWRRRIRVLRNKEGLPSVQKDGLKIPLTEKKEFLTLHNQRMLLSQTRNSI